MNISQDHAVATFAAIASSFNGSNHATLARQHCVTTRTVYLAMDLVSRLGAEFGSYAMLAELTEVGKENQDGFLYQSPLDQLASLPGCVALLQAVQAAHAKGRVGEAFLLLVEPPPAPADRQPQNPADSGHSTAANRPAAPAPAVPASARAGSPSAPPLSVPDSSSSSASPTSDLSADFLSRVLSRADALIAAEFTGSNHARLARKYGLSTRAVHKLLERAKERVGEISAMPAEEAELISEYLTSSARTDATARQLQSAAAAIQALRLSGRPAPAHQPAPADPPHPSEPDAEPAPYKPPVGLPAAAQTSAGVLSKTPARQRLCAAVVRQASRLRSGFFRKATPDLTRINQTDHK